MKLKRSKNSNPPAEQKTPATPEAPGHTWTAGDKFKTLGGATLIGLMLLSGPAAIVYTIVKPEAAVGPVQAEQTPGLSETEQRAGGAGADFVAAWLAATNDDHTEFDRLTALRPTAFPRTATDARDLRLISVTPAPENPEQLLVLVSASTKLADESWVRSYYSVPMLITETQVSPVTLPSQVAVPAPTEKPREARYTTRVVGPVTDTITGFFEAYLTGAGEIDRLLTPGSSIAEVTPAPFTEIQVGSVQATKDVSSEPADGETADLLATISAKSSADEIGITSTYSLAVTARAGRWEITALNPFPVLSDPSTTPTETE